MTKNSSSPEENLSVYLDPSFNETEKGQYYKDPALFRMLGKMQQRQLLSGAGGSYQSQ